MITTKATRGIFSQRIGSLFGFLGAVSLVSGCNFADQRTVTIRGKTAGFGSLDPAPNPEEPAPASPSPTPEPAPGPVGALDPNCMTNPAYDTCIFLKNPVAQKGSPLSPALTPTSNLDSLQIYGVKLPATDGSGFLQNDSFVVKPSSSSASTQPARVQPNASGNWKYPFSTNCSGSTCKADPNHSVGQLMAYYWLNHQKEAMIATTGLFYAANKKLPVITFEPNLMNAYWDGSQVVMGDGGRSKSEFAMGAEIYLHEMGHANLSFASASAGSGTGNCPTAKGCIGAINEGQADYHSAMIFPANGAALGESVMNSTGGLTECGITRTIGGNKNTTLQQVFSACSGTSGEVHLMGRIYASVWWEVRNKAGNVASEVDKLFMEHLRSLQKSDTYVTALSKIKATDQALFNSKYSQDFADEFARRGL